MGFGPKKVTIADIGIYSLGAFIGGIIGSIIIFILIFSLSSLNISSGFISMNESLGEKNAILPLLIAIITFISTNITIFLTYLFKSYANPDSYKKNIIIFIQLAFFTSFMFILICPIYFYIGAKNFYYLTLMFIIHSILTIFGSYLIIEILNNYRYVLVQIYGSFLGLITAIIIVSFIYNTFEQSKSHLISLFLLLPIINVIQIFFKGFFELAYYNYYYYTGNDQIGDIFHRIEEEETQLLKEEEEKNTI